MAVQYSDKWRDGVEGGAKPASIVHSRWSIPAFILVSIVLAFGSAWSGLSNLASRWTHEEEYGYGPLAVGLVVLFLWSQRLNIRALSGGAKWPGLVLVVVAQLCGVLGAMGESYFIEQVSFILTLLGIGIAVFGTGPLRVFFPLAVILLLTVPLPYTLQAVVTLKLQLLSTSIGVAIINLLGIPVFVEGNIIDLGHYKLQVAEACSGLRYLLPLTCISCILAYLYRAPFWKRAIVVACSPVITVLINGARISAVAVLVDNFGSGMADGFIHQFEGWIVFLFGFLLLLIVPLALERFRFSRVNFELSPSGQAIPQPTERLALPVGAAASVLIACVAALVVTSAITWAQSSVLPPARQSFAHFPYQVAEWTGRESSLEPAVLNVLKATDTYTGDFFRAGDKLPVNFFVAYYDSLSRGAAIHSPRVCLPGGGWEFSSFEEKDFQQLTGGTGTFNRVVIQMGETKMLMYYWFQQRERRTASEFGMKFYLLVDSLKRSRKDGALLRVFTPIVGNGQVAEKQAEDRLRSFVKGVTPELPRYLPQ